MIQGLKMKHSKMLLPAVLAFLAPALAQAGDNGSLALAAIYGYGGPWNNRPTVVNNFTPPYFALHPPVYYGDRYYRPYGDSPYASWPQLQPNPAYAPRLQQAHGHAAVTVQNPHYLPVAPTMQSEIHSIPIEQVVPPVAQPKSDQPAQPATVPDVVNRRTGPVTIENPYFRESAQYISKQ
jgi:hypothetical protein